MLSYLQKFNTLPKNVKDAVASPEAAARIAALGQQYKVELASVVMKVVTREFKLDALGAYLVNQLGLTLDTAKALEKDLRKQVFAPVIDFILLPSDAPKLVFAESDEKEVKQAAKPNSTVDYDQAIEEALQRVVEKSHIGMNDPLVGSKFRQVIKTFLRGSRDKSYTLEALTKASELGGVALSRDAAERALGAAALELNMMSKTATAPAKPLIAVPEDIANSKISPFKKVDEYNLEKEIANKNIAPIVKATPVVTKLDVSHEIAPPTPAIVKQAPPTPPPVRKIVKEAISGKPVDKASLRRAADSVPKTIVNFSTSDSGRIRMDDIRFTPQVVGPIDELRYMNLKQFRRLDPNPAKATEKIKEKLELLGKDDYAKKIDGIVAWHSSPLSNLYVQCCRRAMEEGKPVTEILSEERKRDPNSLKNEEVSAIIALNQDLKF